MPGLGDLLGGGSVVGQIFTWGILYGILQQEYSPGLQKLANDANARNPIVPLSPEAAAIAALKGHLDPSVAASDAAKGGVDAGRFETLLRSAGEPPGLEELLSLYRRGDIDDALLHKAVQESAVRDEWWDNGIIQKMGKLPPTPLDFLQSLLEGQVDEPTARKLYETFGGITHQSGEDIFQILFNTRGSAPTPLEAVDMANRGIIPWAGRGPGVTSYEQAFLEGPWRNKWSGPFRDAGTYLIPPRTVVTMVSHGDLSDARAIEILLKQGMTHEDAAAFISEAHGQAVSGSKELAAGEIDTLYYDQAITKSDATSFYGDLGYSKDVADFRLLIQDLKRQRKFLESAISRVHSLYVSYKTEKDPAGKTLRDLQVPESQIRDLFRTWDLERAANVTLLTTAQIEGAFFYKIINQGTAIRKLVQRGYSEYDAWVALSNRSHGPLPNPPPEG